MKTLKQIREERKKELTMTGHNFMILHDPEQDECFRRWLQQSVTELEKRKNFYQKLANKTVQVKRQYFQGKADAFAEALDLLKVEATKKWVTLRKLILFLI